MESFQKKPNSYPRRPVQNYSDLYNGNVTAEVLHGQKVWKRCLRLKRT